MLPRRAVAVLLLISLFTASLLLGYHTGWPIMTILPEVNEDMAGSFVVAERDRSAKTAAPSLTTAVPPIVTVSFRLQHCGCMRTLRVPPKNVSDGNIYLVADSRDIGPDYWKTTCSQDAVHRGPGQQVIGYSFYGSPATARHKAKQYFAGIVENLQLLPRLYPGWVMRLYYDLPADDPVAGQLCELACAEEQLDLCYVRQLPGTPMRDASRVFAMNWRFFPTLDPQVNYKL